MKHLFLVLSAFFLNVEVVAPECVSGGAATFADKFAAVMLLPVCIGVAFFAMHAALTFHKAVVLGRTKKLVRRGGTREG